MWISPASTGISEPTASASVIATTSAVRRALSSVLETSGGN